jgi:hypothetical protein
MVPEALVRLQGLSGRSAARSGFSFRQSRQALQHNPEGRYWCSVSIRMRCSAWYDQTRKQRVICTTTDSAIRRNARKRSTSRAGGPAFRVFCEGWGISRWPTFGRIVISGVAHPMAFILLWRVPRPSFAWAGVFSPHSTNPSCPDLSRGHLWRSPKVPKLEPDQPPHRLSLDLILQPR